ncbi:MAG: ABC transporter permease subunit [Chitinivibrionales bacterium]|nr:ABC transporter permease subunit [Chitinivibrionales bacterium]MBD3395700.1 ABC transporter permease subunit [Chitinivibrionales bacterium]
MPRSIVQGVISHTMKIWPLFPAAIYLLGFLIIVTVYLLGMSFTVVDGGAVSASLAPAARLLALPEFRQALVNTVMFVVVGTPLELVVGLWLALMMYQSFRFRGMMRSMLIIPLAIPALVTATLLFILFDYPGGHINHLLMGRYWFFPAVVDAPVNWRGSMAFSLGISLLGKVWRDMPISMLILLAGLNAIDPELFDAAKTMGAGLRKRLRHVILPLILPSVSAVVLLRSIEMWKEFIFPFVLAGQHDLLGTLIESLYNNWGNSHEAAAVALVLVVCIIVSALVLFRVLEGLRRLLVYA